MTISYLVGQKENDYNETKHTFYLEINKHDSINGYITKEISYNGYTYLTIENNIKLLIVGGIFHNNGYIKKDDISIYDILKKDAFIYKKIDNDTIIIKYKNEKYIFVINESELHK